MIMEEPYERDKDIDITCSPFSLQNLRCQPPQCSGGQKSMKIEKSTIAQPDVARACYSGKRRRALEDRRSTAHRPPCRRSSRGHRPTRHQPTRQGQTWSLRCIGRFQALNRQPRPCRQRQRRPEQNLKLVRILINKKFSPVRLHCAQQASPTGILWPWQSEEYLSFVAISYLFICYLRNILLPLISIE